MRKRLSTTVAILVVFMLMAGCGEKQSQTPQESQTVQKSQENETPKEATSLVAETEAQSAAESDDEGSTDDAAASSVSAKDKRELQDNMMELLQTFLSDEMKEYYELKWDYDNDILYMNATIDGTAEGILNHKDNAKVMEAWAGLCESMNSLCAKTYKAIHETDGLEDCHLCLNIVNDQNPDKTLYSVADDGIVIYDCTKE